MYDNGDLRGINLHHVNLAGAGFWNVDLRGANFSNANLVETAFNTSDMRAVNFQSSMLFRTGFYQTRLQGADFSDVFLKNSFILSEDAINAGYTRHDDHFIAIRGGDSESELPYTIYVGDQNFTLKEAKAYWKNRIGDDSIIDAEWLHKIKLIEDVAEILEWRTGSQASQRTTRRCSARKR